MKKFLILVSLQLALPSLVLAKDLPEGLEVLADLRGARLGPLDRSVKAEYELYGQLHVRLEREIGKSVSLVVEWDPLDKDNPLHLIYLAWREKIEVGLIELAERLSVEAPNLRHGVAAHRIVTPLHGYGARLWFKRGAHTLSISVTGATLRELADIVPALIGGYYDFERGGSRPAHELEGIFESVEVAGRYQYVSESGLTLGVIARVGQEVLRAGPDLKWEHGGWFMVNVGAYFAREQDAHLGDFSTEGVYATVGVEGAPFGVHYSVGVHNREGVLEVEHRTGLSLFVGEERSVLLGIDYVRRALNSNFKFDSVPIEGTNGVEFGLKLKF